MASISAACCLSAAIWSSRNSYEAHTVSVYRSRGRLVNTSCAAFVKRLLKCKSFSECASKSDGVRSAAEISEGKHTHIYIYIILFWILCKFATRQLCEINLIYPSTYELTYPYMILVDYECTEKYHCLVNFTRKINCSLQVRLAFSSFIESAKSW